MTTEEKIKGLEHLPDKYPDVLTVHDASSAGSLIPILKPQSRDALRLLFAAVTAFMLALQKRYFAVLTYEFEPNIIVSF